MDERIRAVLFRNICHNFTKKDLITLFLHFSDVYLDSPHFVLHGDKEYLTLHFKQI